MTKILYVTLLCVKQLTHYIPVEFLEEMKKYN